MAKFTFGFKKFPVGLRILKTSLAVMLSAAFIKYVLNDMPFFACVGAAAAMENSIERSFKAAAIRNVGTIVGCSVGILAGALLREDVAHNSIFLGLGVIPLIVVINLTKQSAAVVPGCITYFATIFLNDPSGTWIYGTERMLHTFIGTAIAIGVNFLILPPKVGNELGVKRVI